MSRRGKIAVCLFCAIGILELLVLPLVLALGPRS
jgi:hypothetical protein